MLRSMFAAVLLLTSATNLFAEIVVVQTSNDLVITADPAPHDADLHQSQGTRFIVYEVNGRVRVWSYNAIEVNGARYRDFNYPSDDVIVNVHNTSTAGNHVIVHGLNMTPSSDDIRVHVSHGDAHIDNCSAGRYSHSSVVVDGVNTSFVDSYARDNLHTHAVDSFELELSGVGDRVIAEAGDMHVENCWIGGGLRVMMDNGQNTLTMRSYLQVDGWVDVDLYGGTDFVDIDLDNGSVLNDSFIDGGTGTDTIYQNTFWFNLLNTNRVEHFK